MGGLVKTMFQSTLPRRERRLWQDTDGNRVGSFNPRSREGSDPSTFTFPLDQGVSIHAPAKGATNALGFDFENFGVSIHAPAKGATY